ncbi:MAG TPA: FtsX-like permease family protein [Actinocrinis sp.]|jgi:putative ABC transport system permease protein
MLKVTIRGLLTHRRRLFGTLLAILLGIGFLAGTLIFNQTLNSNFDNLFTTANAGTDAVVRSAQVIAASGSATSTGTRPPVSAALAGELRSVPGVADAVGEITGYGQILGANGKAVGSSGPPRTAGNWIADPALNPYHIIAGHAPQADDQVVLNQGAAKSGGLGVGDHVTVQLPQPVTFTIVGLADFGSTAGLGGETFVAMTMHAAQQYVAKPGQVSQILVKADSGISQTQLVQNIDKKLPGGLQAITGADYTQDNVSAIDSEFLNFFETFLTAFAVIALVVASFSIYNTFAILLAQRTRESALLRALGARRGQVLTAAVTEAAIMALIGSAGGVLAGLGIAQLLKSVFDAVGFGLPAGGLAVTASTVLIAMVTGLTVTVLAALMPAIRACRVAPLAALREVSADRAGAARVRTLIGLVSLGAGLALTIGGHGLDLVGTGSLLALIGLIVLGPAAARPAAAVLGTVLPRLDGPTGRLARRNAMRDPRRTAATATALMVGMSVVALFTVFSASIKAGIDTEINQTFVGDLVVSSGSFGDGSLSPKMVPALAGLPQVRTAVGIGTGLASVNGAGEQVANADPAGLGQVLQPGTVTGSLASLGADGLAVSQNAATTDHLGLGSRVAMGFTDGSKSTFTVRAIYTDDETLGDYLVGSAAWAPHYPQAVDETIAVKLAPGVSIAAGAAAVQRAVVPFGSPSVEDRSQYAAQASAGVGTFLNVIYALLALAIIIALMGITNSLSLSVHERTRELGMLRAVGLTRPQTRRMVRWESVIVALFGTLGGLGLGLLLGWALVHGSPSGSTVVFSAPITRLAVIAVTGAAAGVLAAARPARRAAKINILTAIAQE